MMQKLWLAAPLVLAAIILAVSVARSTPPSPPPIGSVYPLGYASPSANYVPLAVDANGNAIVDAYQNSTGAVVPATGETPFAYEQMANATTRFITGGTTNKKFHITSFDIETSGSETISIVTGNSTANGGAANCGSSQATVWGPSVMVAGETVARGGGTGDVITTGQNVDVCIVSNQPNPATINGEYAQY
jgi:hypothetical protein